MAQVIKFFERQVMAGNAASAGECYSEVFDVSEFSQIVAELRVYTASGGGTVSGILQHSADPTFASTWDTLGSALTLAAAGASKGSFTNPQRFLRAKVTVPTATIYTVALDAVARAG